MKKRLFFVLIVLTLAGLGLVARPRGSVQAENTRVVTVHENGHTRTIATNARTVKEALNRLGVVLAAHDKTEPSLDQPVLGGQFTINVYHARTIAVVDGANTFTVMTAERSPREIAEKAGFAVEPEDQFAFKRVDTEDNTAPTTEMVIKRAKNITFSLYGTSSPLRTNENTVAELLKERGVDLDKGDEVNVPLAARIVEGMTVSIDRVSKDTETKEEPVPFTIQQIQDVNQPLTYKQVKTAGQNGKKLVTYQITKRNGQEAEKVAIKEVVTQQPVTEVMVVGAKPFASNVSGEKTAIMAAAGIAESDYSYVDYIVSHESGWRVNASNGRTWGLCQALPGSKMSSAGADWQTNPITQMKWCNGYAVGRYGSWAAAYSHWLSAHSW